MSRRWERSWWIIAAVLLIAAVMRLAMLQDIPPGLSRDEVRNADIVSFIRHGEHALFFRTGYGHEPLYHYFSVLFQVLLGDNVLSIRLPAITLGLLLIAATVRWVKRDFGQIAAAVTGFGLAVGWQPVIFSRIGIRPIMEPLFLVAAAWFWGKRPVLAGIFLGLSLYTYTGARVIFALPLLYALIQAIVWKIKDEPVPLRSRIQPPLVSFAITVLVFLPLYITLRIDPTLQARVEQLLGPIDALRNGDIQPILESTLATLSVFSFSGPPRWTYSLPGLPLFNWVTALFFYTGFAIALWRIRFPHYTLILVWLLIGLLPSSLAPHAPSIIRMIGIVPILYLLPGVTISAASDKLETSSQRLVLWLLLLVPYLLLLTSHTLANGFVAWPSAAETHQKYQTVLQDIGRHWEEDPAQAMVVVQNFFEPIEMDTLRRNMGYDAGARWVQAGGAVAGAIVLPSGDGSRLYAPEYAAPHSGLMNAAGIRQQPFYRSEKRPSFAAYILQPLPHIPGQSAPIVFDEKMSFLGYKMGERTETDLELFTYWQVDSSLPPDLTIFVHLLDAEGTLMTQHDGLDTTTSTLVPGDIIVQRHLLPLSANLPDPFSLQVGLYTRGDNKRLTHPGQLKDLVILTVPRS